MTKWDIPSHQQAKREKSVISIDAKQAFDKIQHPCMIKSLSKLGTESNFLKFIKIIYQKTKKQKTLQLTSYLVVRNLKLFLRLGTRQRCPLSTLFSTL